VFLNFFYKLREQGFPAGTHEYLALLQALRSGLVKGSLDELYALSRAIFVKHEAWLDRFDELFGQYFRNEEVKANVLLGNVPEEWLRNELEQILSPEEIDELLDKEGWDALMQRFEELLEKQKGKHKGGNTWIGTGGKSPFGRQGQAAQGMKSGEGSGSRSSIRMWQRRDFANLRDNIELNTRQIKIALRKLRYLTRQGIPDELDLDGTIRKTSENAGMLDIAMRAQRKNRVKVLLLMDVGGSMYDHVEVCEQLFSAAKGELKKLEYFYFHNCVYGSLWKDNKRRYQDTIPTTELLAKYPPDWKLIVVGDAAMAPYELHAQMGSRESSNAISGYDWLAKVREHFEYSVWLNPNADYGWNYFATTKDIRKLWNNRMYPLTLDGLGKAMKALHDRGKSYDEIWTRA
jgi:uncharacterized protein with von Willebrand factor type A (vWA) domain